MADRPESTQNRYDAPYTRSIHPLMPPQERLKLWERMRAVLSPHAGDMLEHVENMRREWNDAPHGHV